MQALTAVVGTGSTLNDGNLPGATLGACMWLHKKGEEC